MGSCFLVYKIARFFLDREGAAITLIIFYNLDGLVKATVNARPYSLALFFSIASVYLFRLWLTSGKRRWQIAYGVSLLLTFYHHYLFLAVGIVHVAYFMFSPDSHVKKSDLVVTYFLTGLLSIPGAFHLYTVVQQSGNYYFPDLPFLSDLSRALFPPFLVVCLLFCLLFTRIYFPFSLASLREQRRSEVVPLLIWYAAPVLLFFGYSWIRGSSLFFWRFYLWYTPAIALLVALMLRAIEPARPRALVVVMICFFTFISPRDWLIEDWRGAAATIRKSETTNPYTPILLYTGLVELDNPKWRRDPERRDYFLAPFRYYSISSEPILLPSIFTDPPAREFLGEITSNAQQPLNEILLVSSRMKRFLPGAEKPAALPKYFLKEFERLGWENEPVRDDGLVRVYRLISKGAPPQIQ